MKINQSPENLLAEITPAFVVIRPTPLTQPVCRDPDDDEVLACAFTARANFIVSGDADLLMLKAYEGIDILNAAQATSRIEFLNT